MARLIPKFHRPPERPLNDEAVLTAQLFEVSVACGFDLKTDMGIEGVPKWFCRLFLPPRP